MYLNTSDSLSLLLQKLELCAEVYFNGEFCGAWAVDTSGSRRIPFHLIGRGQAWLHFQDKNPRRLSTGDLMLFPHDSAHVVANSAEVPDEALINAPLKDNGSPATNMICGFFEFKDKAAFRLIDSLPPAIVLGLDELGSQSSFKGLIDLMIAELKQAKPGYYAVTNQLAYLLFVQILRQQIEAGQLDSGILSALSDTKIGKAINQIHLHPEKKWTLESLAQECAMGRSAFAARFNELVGVPAMQYLSLWRMQEASALLRKTELSLLDVAARSGYDSEASFSKAFKKVTGNTPGMVRRNSRRPILSEEQQA